MSPPYPTDVPYPVAVQPVLNPIGLTYLVASAGATPPALDRPFTCIELGCGSGMSLLYSAACLPQGRFHGLDLDPGAVAQATAFAAAAGLDNVRFFAAGFDRLDDLPVPKAEVILLHGVYSWVGAAERARIRSILAQRLLPGGLAFLDYNCRPGGIVAAELCRIARVAVADRPGDSLDRLQEALAFLDRLRAAAAGPFAQPGAAEILDAWRSRDPGYLVHEMLAQDNYCPAMEEVAADLAAAGLRFVADMEPALNRLELAVPDALRPEAEALADPVARASFVDVVTKRRFRGDVYLRDADPPCEGPPRLDGFRFALAGYADQVRYEHRFPSGSWSAGRISRLLVAALAEGPVSLAEIAALPALRSVAPVDLHRSMTTLVATRQVLPVGAAVADTGPDAPHHRLNRLVFHLALTRRLFLPLASAAGRPVGTSEATLLLMAAMADSGRGGAVARAMRAVGDGTIPVGGRSLGGAALESGFVRALHAFDGRAGKRLAKMGALPPELSP